MHIRALDYFRGIAIVLIVAGHSYGSWRIDTVAEKTLANLITGGSALFVFISGFFFHHIYYTSFDYFAFLKKKLRSVFVPYLVLSTMAFFYLVEFKREIPFSERLFGEDLSGWQSHLWAAIVYLWTGRILTAYWYVPFIMLVFASSPIFMLQIRLSLRLQCGILIGLILVAALIQRPVANLSPIHSLLYFLPFYVSGILCSILRANVFAFLRGKYVVLGIATLMLALIQARWSNTVGNSHKSDIWAYQGVDILLFQKIVMCAFLLSLLQEYEESNLRILAYLASISFALYFLHPWVIVILRGTWLLQKGSALPGVAEFLMTWALTLMISIGATASIKQLLREKSRYFIGS